MPDKFATDYESALAFGVASEIDGPERHHVLQWLLEKYCPDFIEAGRQYIEQKETATKVFKIEVNHLSGKARR